MVHAVSGRHCESGDLLVKEAMLPSDTQSGDILMSTSTGAYTFAMASNYNRVPKSGVVAVSCFWCGGVSEQTEFSRYIY